jgi:beta-phosphoglucomutase-like phosphatase (HAD superfamily)
MTMISSRPRWVLATTLLVTFEASSSFLVTPRVSPLPSIGSYERPTREARFFESNRDLSGSRPRSPPQKTIRTWATPDEGDEATPPPNKQQLSNQEIYEGLYEFLTRRTGEQAGESERRRKRDRILDWMGSGASPSTSGGGASKLVQPIRTDGTVIEEDPPRQKVKFDTLFKGMPTLDEILSREGASTSPSFDSTAPVSDESLDGKKSKPNTAWFEQEKRQIQAEYEQIIEDMKSQIRQQREEDPESMPDNAEGVAESVARQEMDRIIKSVKVARAKERLQQYEVDRISELDSQDMTNTRDKVVDKILDEASQDWERKMALQEDLDDFLRYEKQARQSASDENVPLPGKDLDAWALERMESMLEATLDNASKEGAAVTDILEEQIDDLRQRIEKESKKGPVKPRTMKEWQMYRAIANRLGQEIGLDPNIDAALNLAELEEEQVSQRLDAWRDYVGREEEIRKQAGLTSGPKMPFDWHSADGRQEVPAQGSQTTNPKSRRDIRREVNMQALQAFEALVEKSDPVRAESLTKQLEALRAELEPLDYLDLEEEPIEEQQILPVDLTGVFGSRGEVSTRTMLPSTLYEQGKDIIDQVLAADAATIYESDTGSIPPSAPTQTPFWTDDFDNKYGGSRPAPPKTPFFSDAVSSATIGQADVQNSKLGSVDEQKLLNMYRRAGARTKEEQDSIREQWEAFQALERSKRDASGLSDADNASLVEMADLKYDLNEVMKGDGDFDAEKILSTIGPRPTRKKKTSQSTKKSFGDDGPPRELDPAQVSESIFRSVSAVGGGRVKDEPESRDKQKAEFEEYMRREEEMRKNLDNLDEAVGKSFLDTDASLDDPNYAQDVLASIGPRPTFKRKKKQSMKEQELSDRGGNIDVADDDEVDDEDNDEPVRDMGSSSIGVLPDWLKKERKDVTDEAFSGRKIDEVFDDDAYDHNLRQLHEYEQRRSGKQKQIGIDISDVLGNRARSSDDYADYLYDTDYFRGREGSWGETSFRSRKANLLHYVELSTPEVNNLMDHRDSVYSSGVSQYLSRVNKPFKEFGAIFRLEGVLLDLTGMHQEAWARVASEFGYKAPPIEEMRQAAVTRPERAIREVFYWTNDVIGVRQANERFGTIFREVFDKWAAANGLLLKPFAQPVSMALGAEAISDNSDASEANRLETPRFDGEQSKLKRFQEAWTVTATELELARPTNEQIAQSTFLAPEIAVRDVFRWTSDEQDIGAVVAVFKAILNGDVDKSNFCVDLPAEVSKNQAAESSLLEAQYKAWMQVAQSRFFELPTPEEVLVASVLNDPEAVIVRGFGWTSSANEAKQLADEYRGHLSMLVTGQPRPKTPDTVRSEILSQNTQDVSSSLAEQAILEAQIAAWATAAEKHRFTPPKIEQIQLTTTISPGDAVRRLLGWTYNFNEGQIEEITSTYSKALLAASKQRLEAYTEVSVNVAPLASSPVSKSKPSKEISADELYKAAFDAWTTVAWQSGYSLPDQLPDQEKVQFAMAVGPEEAIVVGFKWTESYEKAAEIASMYRDKIKLKRTEWIKNGYDLSSNIENKQAAIDHPMVVVREGVYDWIKSLLDVEMACGVTSYLTDEQVDILLNYAGLCNLLPQEKRVTLSNGYDRDSQQMLGVALRIERRPDHCIVFDSSPVACDAAHEVDMRSVAMVGPYPRYELLSADTSAVSFSDLTAMNIRRLFGERVYDQPMLDRLQSQPEVRRKTKTAFWDPDE